MITVKQSEHIVKREIKMNQKKWNNRGILDINGKYIKYNKLHEHQDFDISWVENEPEKDWNFKKMHIKREYTVKTCMGNFNQKEYNSKFDLTWIDRFSEKEWDFKDFANLLNFHTSWIEKYPNKEWGLTEEEIREFKEFERIEKLQNEILHNE